MKRCFTYSHYDAQNKIDDYVIYELQFLSELGDVIFVSDCECQEDEYKLKQIDNLIYTKIETHNGYDFWSYREGDLYLYDNDLLKNYDIIYHINDSILFPIDKEAFIEELIKIENKDSVDIVGLDYRVKSIVGDAHIQSYFTGFKSQTYDDLIDFVPNSNKPTGKTKQDIRNYTIQKYEIGLSQYFIKKQYKLEGIFTWDFYRECPFTALTSLKKKGTSANLAMKKSNFKECWLNIRVIEDDNPIKTLGLAYLSRFYSPKYMPKPKKKKYF